ncbi:MAG TPA: ABC transporter permease [Candidatus Thermoplasmatota archaeon]|nr:ABC transporter permease [Candidatus Thermoplasmatota archaeon]
MRGMLAVAGKDLRDILRERSILASLVVQLFVAGFSTFLSVGLTGLYDPASVEAFPRAEVGYAGPAGEGFDDYLVSGRNLQVVPTTAEAGLQAFRDGRLAALVEETVDPGDGPGNGTRSVTLLMADGTLQTTLLLTQVKGLLQDYEHDLRVAEQGRLQQQVLRVEAPAGGRAASFGFTYGTLLPLLVLTPIFLSGAIAGDAFVQEAQTRTLLLLRASPLSVTAMLAGKLLVPVVLAPAQVLLWVGLLRLNGIAVQGLGAVLLLTMMLALLLASLGIALATWVRKEGQVQASYALVVLLLAVASLLLPHDVLNLIALLASGTPPPSAWVTFGILAAAAALCAGIGLPFAARRIQRDQV